MSERLLTKKDIMDNELMLGFRKMVGININEFYNKYNINIYYTDIDKYTKTDLKKFNNLISFDGGTPVTIFIKNGEEKTTATRIEGDVSTDKIIDKLKKNGFID